MPANASCKNRSSIRRPRVKFSASSAGQPINIQPVFDTIAQSAARLCDAQFCRVFRFDGKLIHYAASHGVGSEGLEATNDLYPMPPGRRSAAARAILSGAVEQIPDVQADPEYGIGRGASVIGFRSVVAVPMLKEGRPIGAIAVLRSQAGLLPERQITLLRTFADQAVIAIENTRLFEAEQTRTRELTERTQELTQTLEYQTATSEVLGVISRSPSELQPVLDAILRIAGRLCEAEHALFYMLKDGKFRVSAARSINSAAVKFATEHPISLGEGTLVGRTAIERRPVHISDCLADPDFTFLASQRIWNFRSLLGVPLLRDGEPIGVLSLMRMAVKPFTQGQIDLVTTFGNQALIAIENARLFEEVRARNRDLTALGEVGRAVSSRLDLRVVLKTVVERAVALSGTDAGSIFYYREDGGTFELGETSGFEEEVVARLRKLDIAARDTALGEAIAKRRTIQVPDVMKRPSTPLRNAVMDLGLNAALIIPLLRAEDTFGALVLRRRQPGEFSQSVVKLMESFADQSVIALENAHLFEEIAQKSRELEIASQHKSQFVANMSHELRTPLAAILGYAELMQEGFYEPLGQKSLDTLSRIRSNGKHLLGLINTVLDIAKIESGQFILNMAEYDIQSVVETVRAATESLAETKKLALRTDVAKPLPTASATSSGLPRCSSTSSAMRSSSPTPARCASPRRQRMVTLRSA
jgi:GAF domain-containing protein